MDIKFSKKLPSEDNKELIVTLPKDTTTYTDRNVINGKSYIYYVKTYNKKGALSAKKEVYASPTELVAVQGITIKKGTSSITVTWDIIKSNDLGGYNIYKSNEKDSEYKKIKKVTGNSFTDFNLKTAETVFYKIVTLNKKNEEGKETDPIEVKF